jgi:effector-binding domain-containing protein
MAVPVKPGSDLANVRSFSGGRYYKMWLRGDYQFLDLAWYKIFSQVRMLKLKFDAKRPSLEIYENDPESVDDSNELSTCLYLPVK